MNIYHWYWENFCCTCGNLYFLLIFYVLLTGTKINCYLNIFVSFSDILYVCYLNHVPNSLTAFQKQFTTKISNKILLSDISLIELSSLKRIPPFWQDEECDKAKILHASEHFDSMWLNFAVFLSKKILCHIWNKLSHFRIR